MSNTENTLDFLDTVTAPEVSSSSSAPEGFSEAAQSASGPDTTVPEVQAQANTTASDTSDAEKPKYANISATYADESEVPEGTTLYTVSEFASRVSVKNIQNGMGVEGVIKDAAVYTAMKAVRNPLPVVLVGSGENVSAFLSDDAFTAWDARPVRGEGSSTATGGKLTDDALLKAAADVSDKVAALTKRLASVQDRLTKAENLKGKRDAQLKARNLTWADVEKWQSEHETVIPDASDNDTTEDNSTQNSTDTTNTDSNESTTNS